MTKDPQPEIRILETPDELRLVEDLSRLVWPGSDLDVVPVHLMRAVIDHGGLAIGAFLEDHLVGFVFGFPGFENTPQGPRLVHASHQAGIHPDYRDRGLGFRLKRAQWQMVRQQGIDRIQWTYDPLLSRNARLNITKLGAVCNTYIREFYGEMRDGLNTGLPSDRFRVDLWVNSPRVQRKMSSPPPRKLDLAHYLSAETPFANHTQLNAAGLVEPLEANDLPSGHLPPLVLLEIPSDFQAIKAADPSLALRWRLHSRALFEDLFQRGYLVTDFIYLPGGQPRSFYVLTYGESTF